MNGQWALWWRLRRGVANSVRLLATTQRSRVVAVTGVLLVVWALLGSLFLYSLRVLDSPEYRPLKARLLESMLSLFFFTLGVLVVVSATVLIWSGLFRTRTALFQAQLPCTNRALFWGATLEGSFWSGWAVVVLAVPLVGSLMRDAAQRTIYVPAGALVLAAFIACCVAAGSLGALALARLIPALRRGLSGIVALVVLALAAASVLILGSFDYSQQPSNFMQEVIGRISFAENPYLPPWWTQQALTAALHGEWDTYGHAVALLISTAAALGVIAEHVAHRRLRFDLDLLSGRPDGVRRLRSRSWRRFPLLPNDLALLVEKDLRLFRRDPAQVLQFTVFFGLLAFYLLMLPRLGRAFVHDNAWRPVVSLLNLTAIAMALATFTGRFVYPLLSLEGKRLWVLVLAPWPRHRVVTAKLAFALLVGLPVSVMLVGLSGLMLELGAVVALYQMFTIACLAVGLSAGALGIGACLADYHEDNPGKLVAGYGGNINLLISLLFSALLIAGAAMPLLWRNEPMIWWLGLGWTLCVTIGWSWLSLRMAWRWFAVG